MEDNRNVNFKKNKPKYNELNHIISNYFKSELDKDQKIENLLGDISKIKKRFKMTDDSISSKTHKNINSPSFGCDRPKSVDDIISNNSNTSQKKNNNNNYKKITYYKKPRHYIHNRSVDNVKCKKNIKENNRYINNNYDNNNYSNNNNNTPSNYNTYNSKLISPIYSTKNDQFQTKKKISTNTLFSKIDSNEYNIKENTQNLEKENFVDNIFTKIPTNISRIKKNNNDSIEQSSEFSLLNNNNSYNENNNNYCPINYQNKKNIYNNNNNNNINYNNTFYNENIKNLSINIPQNTNGNYNYTYIDNDKENSIKDSTRNKNNNNKEDISKRIYYKTPIIRNKIKNNKKYYRKISDDFYNDKNKKNIVNDLLSTGNKKKEDYYSNDTTNTNTNTINNNYYTNTNTNTLSNNKKLTNNNNNDKFQKIISPKTNKYKDYLTVFNLQKQIEYIDNINYNNYSTIKISNNNTKVDNKIFKYKKLSSYILKNKNNEEKKKGNNNNNRKYNTKSYDNCLFKQKIKKVKRKKRPKRRNKTFDDNTLLDKPSATPIKKEDDKGGKVDLYNDKIYNTSNTAKLTKNKITCSEDFNHEININIKNIKINLKKIILIQNWWRSMLQKKIIKFNQKFNEYKIKQKNKLINSNKDDKIKIFTKKRYLDKNKYKSVEITYNFGKDMSDSDINDFDENIPRKNISKKCYVSKARYRNQNTKIIYLQKNIKNHLRKNKNKYIFHDIIKQICYIDKLRLKNINNNKKSFDLTKLNESFVNDIYLGKNENKYKMDNFIYHRQSSKILLDNNINNTEMINSTPLINRCYISKIYGIKKKEKKNNDLKIINEANDEYIKIPIKKPPYEINNIISKEIIPVKNKKPLTIQKIENQILNKVNNNNIINIKLPKIIICHISKINCLKYKKELIKYPFIEKNEYITKLIKDKSNIKSIIFLQKYISKYLNRKKNNRKIFGYNLNKPISFNCYISKINKSNLSNDIKKIQKIQKKFREHQNNIYNSNLINTKNCNSRNYMENNYNNKNSILELKKSCSSNDTTSQRSKISHENKLSNLDGQNTTRSVLKKANNILDLTQMIIQKISKNINQYVFYKIKNEKIDKNIFFSTIKRLINIYSNLLKNKFSNNDIIKFIKDNLSKNIYDLNKYNYLSFIPKKEEYNLISTQLFLYNDKELVNFICTCLKIEHELLINNNINNLIQYRLIKEPLKDHNIFTIMRYMDMLYDNISNKNICLSCFCKAREKCGINCKCHNSSNLSHKYKNIKFVPQPKIKTHSSSLSYSFDEINNKKTNNDDIEIVSNVLLYDRIFKRNIYYTISKVEKLNNSFEESESEIDIFQKMNKGTQSLMKREKINKIFDEYNQEKLNKYNNIFNESENQKGHKIRHISKLSSSSDIVNIPNCEEEDNMLNKIKKYLEENK